MYIFEFNIKKVITYKKKLKKTLRKNLFNLNA
jgi:hypothetical protein